jgi:predicted membrane channel-forming protein YqfA (hemolysin III family)
VTTFFSELWFIVAGPVWYGQLFFLLIGGVGVLAWTGVLKTFVTILHPGNPAGLVLIWLSVVVLSVGVAVYRSVWPGPARPILGFIVPLAAFLVMGAIGIWLCSTSRPPRFVVPPWMKDPERPDAEGRPVRDRRRR